MVNPVDFIGGFSDISNIVSQRHVIVFERNTAVYVEGGVEGSSVCRVHFAYSGAWCVVDAEVVASVT